MIYIFQPEGHFANKTETSTMFVDLQPSRPVIHRLYDHGSQVIPEGKLESKYIDKTYIWLQISFTWLPYFSSEYRNNFSTAPKGDRPMPVWISKFEKVTIGGDGNRA